MTSPETAEAEKKILRHMKDLRRHLEISISSRLAAKLSIDDLVQETLLRALSTYSETQFSDDSKILAWLKKIAMNLSVSGIRKKANQSSSLTDGSSEVAQFLIDSQAITPSSIVSAKENVQILALALSRLPTHYRDVIDRRYREQLSFEEIASKLNTTDSAVRGLHRNAIESLKNQLGDIAMYVTVR